MTTQSRNDIGISNNVTHYVPTYALSSAEINALKIPRADKFQLVYTRTKIRTIVVIYLGTSTKLR